MMKIPFYNLLFTFEDYMMPCLNKKLFGFDCPGCGLQRSIALIMKGEFIAAFEMYPAIYAIILLFGFLLVDRFFNMKYSNQIIITLTILTVTLILTNYVLKLL